jgi:hypothetical protein
VLNPDGPPWCSLARALLERHLSVTRKATSDLLAGSVSRWHLKDASPLWRNPLRTWDVLRGSMHSTIRPPPGVAIAVSASTVSRRSEDDRPCLAMQAWWRAGIRYAHDLVQWYEYRSHLCVWNVETSIHQRLRSELVQDDIRTSSLFDHLNSTDRQLHTEYEAIWHLALLTGKSFGQYRPSMRRLYQQQLSSPATAASDVEPSETAWRYVHHETLMPKICSLLWTIHENACRTAAKLATFTSVSPVCPQYGQHTETMVHELMDCQLIRLL